MKENYYCILREKGIEDQNDADIFDKTKELTENHVTKIPLIRPNQNSVFLNSDFLAFSGFLTFRL